MEGNSGGAWSDGGLLVDDSGGIAGVEGSPPPTCATIEPMTTETAREEAVHTGPLDRIEQM